MNGVKVVEPRFEILTSVVEIVKFPQRIEEAARMCYRSEANGHPSAFVRARIAQGHESVIEHCSISVRFVLSRAAANQLVRHRLASFTQESLRYVKQAELEVIKPKFEGSTPGAVTDRDVEVCWSESVEQASAAYCDMLKLGMRAEDARSVLPLCTATRILVTANLREWRHILRVRTDRHAQAEIRTLMTALQASLRELLPCVFGPEQKAEVE